mgnify:FL=1
MNKTYKTVFSKARGAMIVANELTKVHAARHSVAVAAGLVMACTVNAATVTVDAGSTYQENITIGAAETLTNNGTINNTSVTVTNGTFVNNGVINTGEMTVFTKQNNGALTGTINASTSFTYGSQNCPSCGFIETYNNTAIIKTPVFRIVGTKADGTAVATGYRFTKQDQLDVIDDLQIESHGKKTGAIFAQNTAFSVKQVTLLGNGNDARLQLQNGASVAVDNLVVNADKGMVQIDSNGSATLKNVKVGNGSYFAVQTNTANHIDGIEEKIKFSLGQIDVGEGSSFKVSVYQNNPAAYITGDVNVTLAKDAMADFGGFKEEGNTDWKPQDIHFEANSLTINVKDPNHAAVYLPATEGNVTTAAENIKVIVDGAANTGNAAEDLKAGGSIVQLVTKVPTGNATEIKSGTVVEQLANEIYDSASGVVGEGGTVSDIVVTNNPATHGIAEMTALGVQIWRSEINDMNKRLGELRDSSGQENGLWARVYNGKAKYGAQNVTNKYTSFQFGYDRQVTPGIWLGGAMSYTDGNNDFKQGDGDSSLYAFTAYGSWLGDNGMFLDVTGKVGRMKNSFDIATDLGLSSGSYHTNTVSMSAEAGWRFYPMQNTFFVEPQVEVMYGHVFDADYTTSLGVQVNQASTDSLIGRAGFALGMKCPNNRGNAYVRASVLHDWKGDAESTYSKNGITRTLSEDLGDTWLEYGIGANINAIDNLHFYADLEATENAKVETSYRFNVGVRYAF